MMYRCRCMLCMTFFFRSYLVILLSNQLLTCCHFYREHKFDNFSIEIITSFSFYIVVCVKLKSTWKKRRKIWDLHIIKKLPDIKIILVIILMYTLLLNDSLLTIKINTYLYNTYNWTYLKSTFVKVNIITLFTIHIETAWNVNIKCITKIQTSDSI